MLERAHRICQTDGREPMAGVGDVKRGGEEGGGRERGGGGYVCPASDVHLHKTGALTCTAVADDE
jgi:hypothetical protein